MERSGQQWSNRENYIGELYRLSTAQTIQNTANGQKVLLDLDQSKVYVIVRFKSSSLKRISNTAHTQYRSNGRESRDDMKKVRQRRLLCDKLALKTRPPPAGLFSRFSHEDTFRLLLSLPRHRRVSCSTTAVVR
jgi:sugar diacid utilization regulator